MANYFTAVVNGEKIELRCWASSRTITHYCEDNYGRRTRVCWCNRTWEEFRFAEVLRRAIEKFPKGMQDELRAQIIDRKATEEKERADAMFSNFKRLHDGLNDENKKRLADSGIVMQSEDDARAVMGLMGLLTLMQD